MTKKNKVILISSLLAPVAFISTAAILSQVACSTNSDTTQNNGSTQPFVDNANKNFLDFTNNANISQKNMSTKNVVKEILSSKIGIEWLTKKVGETLIVKWFQNNKLQTIKSFYDDSLKSAQDSYKTDKDNSKDDQIFQNVTLDPKGGSEKTFIFSALVSTFKTKFIENLFFNDYLCINNNGQITQLNENTSQVSAAVNSSTNVNGAAGAGTRNNFAFNAGAIPGGNNGALDAGYADFMNFVFEQWTKSTLPISTPSLLFKNDSDPLNSQLFNQSYFGGFLTTDASYKFQYFKPANQDFTSPNASMLYKVFVDNQESYINKELGGAILLPSNLTQDSSTQLVTNVATCYNDLVTPYSAAAMYKLNNAIFGTTSTDSNVPESATFSADGIMNNFISTAPTDPGVFVFPYISGTENPFSGVYSGMKKGIKETVNITNKPWIITRDEFGVHIIGIDRFDKIKEATTSKNGVNAFKAALVEIQNTILWRAAQEKALSMANGIGLQNKLKDYCTNNLEELVVKYVLSKSTGTAGTGTNLFGSTDILNSAITVDNSLIPLLNAGFPILDALKAIDYKKLIQTKILANQQSYLNNEKPSEWKSFGIAGVLPYTRTAATGNYDKLNVLADLAFTPDNLDALKIKYSNALNSFLTLVEPATDANYWTKYNLNKVAVSKYVFTNNFYINQILLESPVTDLEVSMFNLLTDEKNLYDFYDFNTNKFKNSSASITPPPVVDANTTDFNALNGWINANLQKAFDEEYIPSVIFANMSNKFQLGNWTTKQELLTLVKNEWNLIFNDNKYSNSSYLNISLTDDLRIFLKSLYWLMGWDETKKTYTFSNFIDILKEMVNVEDNDVSYVAWTTESNLNALNSFGSAATFGLTGNLESQSPPLDQNPIEKTINNDFKTFKPNAIYLNKTNSYSYQGAANPLDATNFTFDKAYLGTNETYFSSAKTSNNIEVNGFLGFQSSKTAFTNNVLPLDLYSGNLLTQNISNNKTNFKGIFYQYNTNGDASAAKTKFINDIDTLSIIDVGFLANKISKLGFGLSNESLNILNGVFFGTYYPTNGKPETWDDAMRRTKLKEIANLIPIQAFEKLNSDLLWNNIQNPTVSSTVFTDKTTGKLTEFLVTQYNTWDIDALMIKATDGTKKCLDPTKLLGLNPETFFKCLVKLALSDEVKLRANNHFTSLKEKEENKVNVFHKPLADKLGENIVKNWKDF